MTKPASQYEGSEFTINDCWPMKNINVPEPALPPADLRLKAFSYFPPEETEVIILGQDPYPATGKANGLAFGIHPDWKGVRYRSSFGNIFDEVARWENPPTDVDHIYNWSTLEGWAEQGVLLTNTRLSVTEGKPMSHAGMGWEHYVGLCVQVAVSEGDPILVAFGSEARKFFEKQLKFCGYSSEEYKASGKLLCFSHPCKYSAGRDTKHSKAFKGSNCFAEINRALINHRRSPINWWAAT